MDRSLLSASRAIERRTSVDEVFDLFAAAIEPYGLRYIIYVTVADSPDRDLHLLSNFPQDWRDAIDGDDAAFDPFLDYCCSTYDITLTGAEFLEDYPYLDDRSVAFIRAAEQMGFRSGLGIPMRLQGSPRYGGFNLGSAHKRADFERQILPKGEMFRAFCLFAHRRIDELRDGTVSSMTRSNLSPREKQCITLIAAGHRIPQIADSLKISVPAVRLYLRNARGKLGAATKEQAVAFAMQKGLLEDAGAATVK